MADVNIGLLPAAQAVYDDSLLVMEQQGEALKVSGQLVKEYARQATADFASSAEKSSEKAQSAAYRAELSERNAKLSQNAIENMEVSADTLQAGAQATVRKELVNGVVRLVYGIPQGLQGATGPTGPQGGQGPPGPQGINGVAVAADGQYAFNVNEDGDLILSYTGDTAPNMRINENGELILTV